MYRIDQALVVTNENIASLKYKIKYKPQEEKPIINDII